MLEFIVLGQIPGTNIYLSFETVALISLSLLYIAAIGKLAKIGWRAEFKKLRDKKDAIVTRISEQTI